MFAGYLFLRFKVGHSPNKSLANINEFTVLCKSIVSKKIFEGMSYKLFVPSECSVTVHVFFRCVRLRY